jgi:hypothetical protein
MPVIFDCEAKETKIVEEVSSSTDITKVARIKARELFTRRRMEGVAKPHIIPVINRANNEMRWFNIGSNNPRDINYAPDGDASWVIYAETLVGPKWRLATKAEETAELQRQKEESKEAIKKALNYEMLAGGARIASMASDARFQHIVDKAAAFAEEEKQDAAKKEKDPKKDK